MQCLTPVLSHSVSVRNNVPPTSAHGKVLITSRKRCPPFKVRSF